ncbi:MAG: HdeA family protein [Beijerinckiaceae bacterium]|nr:HdeA family protein [Beijerinckiaceae bacterium]MCI0735943.1 HdeA family protein [Beijerinckiaceae bacterium]
MMKQASLILAIAGTSALGPLCMTAPVQAKTAAEWTCSEFLEVPKAARPHVVYFMTGLHKSDKLGSADIAAKDFSQPIGKIVDTCEKDQSKSLWDAIVNHFYWRAMEIP